MSPILASPHFEKSTKIINDGTCSLWLAIPFRRLAAALLCKDVCLIVCTPFTKITYVLTSPIYLLGAVLQSYLRCCLLLYSPHFASNKTTHNCHIVLFPTMDKARLAATMLPWSPVKTPVRPGCRRKSETSTGQVKDYKLYLQTLPNIQVDCSNINV